MDDIEDILADFAVPFVIQRRVSSTVTKGRAALAAATPSNASGTITPASGKDLLRLPEGRRTQGQVIRIITTTLLLTLPQADVIDYRGISYEVQDVGSWDEDGFYDCLAQQVVQT